ncbi:MAG: aryl-sulfate sulfotransferase [Planctomycetota bacterium]
MSTLVRLLIVSNVLLMSGSATAATDPTVGWLEGGTNTAPGYVLFAPINSTETYLIDDYGRVVHSWSSANLPGFSVYLREDGVLVRSIRQGSPTGGLSAGGVEYLDWDSNELWVYWYTSPTFLAHHDVEPMPNGNVLLLAWDRIPEADAIAAGKDPALLSPATEIRPEHIVEVTQTGPTTGTIVWEWHLWDHVIQDFDATKSNFGVVADHPELVDLNIGNTGFDWVHANSIDYNPTLDQIAISCRGMDEFWIIDHSTTTAEAAGHTGGLYGKGGDLLYRWGNPANYGAGGPTDQRMFKQHCVEWILPGRPGAGNLLIFNNGNGRPGGDASSIDELIPPVDAMNNYILTPGTAFGPTSLVWTYMAPTPTDFFSPFVSGARRLPNGNTIICDGPAGLLFEVETTGAVVWRYRNPTSGTLTATQGDTFSTPVFRVNRHEPSYPGFAGRTLTPGLPIEFYPAPGDFNNDGSVDATDQLCFESLFTGSCALSCTEPTFANAAGYTGDFDGDGDIDCTDWAMFEAAWTNSPATPAPFPTCTMDFLRGDTNADGSVNVADAVRGLGYLFATEAVGCVQTVDMNDDEIADISDPIYLLAALFASGPPLAAPNTICGADPTPGALGCEQLLCP